MDIENYKKYNEHYFENSNTISLKPKVSICFVTYKQEGYIKMALDSVLNQQTNFEYEIVIGDDASPDSNPEIIKEYALKYPNKIRAFLHPYNLGPKEIPSKNNFLHTFFQCNGQYIVHLEGDDYFTNINKLQKQVDFLDKNPQYSACFHNAEIVYEDNSGRNNEYVNPENQKLEIEILDLIKEKETWFMATAAVMMRKNLVHPLPNWFANCKSGDIPLYGILTKQGKIGYIPEVMSVYRKNWGGISYTDIHDDANFINNRIYIYNCLNKHTKYKYKDKFDSIIADYNVMLANCYQNRDSILKRAYFASKAIILKRPLSFNEFIKKNILTASQLNNYFAFRHWLNRILLIKNKA